MNRYTASRPIVLSLVRVLLVQLTSLPALHGAPIVSVRATGHKHMPEGMAPDDPHLWIYLGIAVVLVLMGGAFAGLTIALMGQDEIYLQVIESSGEDGERKNAHSVLKLLKRGKHWVLVTLLLSNVITNETLPIILDRSLGGGWPAVLSSTVLIVIFGEVVPQSVCVRYGLPIGAWMAPFVLALMYILGPVAWPTAKLLDWILGEDHGTVYKKAGLKTLVTLHKTLGSTPADRLNQDEVTIISAVLDLKEKSVGSIMTPMEDVFTMSTETILDEKTMDIILSAGYSRIPIHTPDNPENFVGMLLVKILITYDPEDAKRVGDFALATLPETRPETSCLDIVNFFQEGKSHMVLVSEYPAEDHGALGVVTLEDVIEELIGEEIIDESDVFIDVHKAIRRLNPAPKARVPKGEVVTDIENSQATQEEADLMDISENTNGTPKSSIDERSAAIQERVRKLSRQQLSSLSTSPKFSIMRRSSSSAGVPSLNLRLNDPQMREHLKHIGPSNLASKPKGTRYSTVKIKPAGTESKSRRGSGLRQNSVPVSEPEWSPSKALQRAETVGLLDSAGREATAEVEQAQSVYGTMDRPQAGRSKTTEGNIEVTHDSQVSQKSNKTGMSPESAHRPQTLRRNSSGSHSTLGSLPRKYHSHSSGHTPKGTVRTGSITENIVDVGGGVKKIVLDLTSSSEDADEDHANGDDHNDPAHAVEGSENDSIHDNEPHSSHKKTRRRKRKKARSHHDQAKTLLD